MNSPKTNNLEVLTAAFATEQFHHADQLFNQIGVTSPQHVNLSIANLQHTNHITKRSLIRLDSSCSFCSNRTRWSKPPTVQPQQRRRSWVLQTGQIPHINWYRSSSEQSLNWLIARLLLVADPFQVDSEGYNLLHKAVAEGVNSRVLSHLLSFYADKVCDWSNTLAPCWM